jgi:D-alanine-D-alanine ligase
MARRLLVGLLYNLKKHIEVRPAAPPDALAEYDSTETVAAIEAALRSAGHDVIPLEADTTLLDTVRRAAPDICFNIAEGLHGDARESHAPALLEMLRIPYTGSRVLAHAISLDKGAAKHMWRDAGLPTTPFQVLRHGDERVNGPLQYPLFIKPLREGSGMGIDSGSIAANERQLRERVSWLIRTYRQPALVEAYLPGREFTVGLIGNGRTAHARLRPDIYDSAGYHLFPVLEIDPTIGAGRGVYNTAAKAYVPGEHGAPTYTCPAAIPGDLVAELKRLAVAAFQAIDALDVGRVDFRLGRDGRSYLMEINTLPGLNPLVSDLCIMARAESFPYDDLINEILQLAVERYEAEGLRFRDLSAAS